MKTVRRVSLPPCDGCGEKSPELVDAPSPKAGGKWGNFCPTCLPEWAPHASESSIATRLLLIGSGVE